MYYYLFESTQNKKNKHWQAKFKEKLANAGIAGESVSPSPARTIDELIQMGLDKGYSTSVAIGNDSFINKVASSLVVYSLKSQKEKIVLGVVPLQKSESFFDRYVDFSSDEHVIDMLRARYLKTISVGLIQPNKFFLNPLQIERSSPFRCTLKTAQYSAKIHTTDLTIDSSGCVTAVDLTPRLNIKAIFAKILKRSSTVDDKNTKFQVKRAELVSDEILPIQLNGEIIAKTPIVYQFVPDVLHLIVNRDILD